MKKKEDNTAACWWWLASLFMAFILAVIATGCSKEEVVPVPTQEGLPATIRIDVNAHEPATPQTRAVNESAIHDLHVLVYNSAGELIGKNYATTTSSIVVKARSAQGCTIYVIANTNNATFLDGVVTTEAKLKALTTKPLTGWDELTNNTHLVMVGSRENVDIAAGSNTIGSIAVARIAARVTLTIKTDNTDITIKDYKVCSLPALSYYIPNPTSTEANEDDIGNADAGKDAAADLSKWIEGTETNVNANAFQTTFYMYENRRGVKAGITEQKDKIKTQAPLNATYVMIKGEAAGYTATWVIYLGANNTSNFNIKRNCSYTYTIQLKEGNIADTRVDVDEKAFPTTVGASSNCYMLLPGHAITIPVSRANESPIAIGGTTTQIVAATEWEAEIVWQSSPFLVYLSRSTRTGKGANGRFTVAATDATKQGNAVVAIKNVNGDILWSWHIWITTYTGYEKFTTYNGKRNFVFMDRALGATSNIAGDINSNGLIYQWGRKDPFPGIGQDGGSWSITTGTDPIRVYNSFGRDFEIAKTPVSPTTATPNNLTNAIRHPDTFYSNRIAPTDWFVYDSNTAQDNSLWGSADSSVSTAALKSVFDPCPKGWRVPPFLNSTSPFVGMSTNGSSSWSDSAHGRTWSGTGGYFPASGYRPQINGSLQSVSTLGYYWSGAIYLISGSYVYFSNGGCIPSDYGSRANGFPLRCCQDPP